MDVAFMQIFCLCTSKLADGTQAGIQINPLGQNEKPKLRVLRFLQARYGPALRREEDRKPQELISISSNLTSNFSGRSLQSSSGAQKPTMGAPCCRSAPMHAEIEDLRWKDEDEDTAQVTVVNSTQELNRTAQEKTSPSLLDADRWASMKRAS